MTGAAAGFRAAMRGALFAAVAVLLAGCSALRLTYEQGPTLAYWWLDGYADFDRAQARVVRGALREWFAWHRQRELPVWRALLDDLADALPRDTTSQAVCALGDRMRERAQVAYAAAVPPLAELAVTMQAPQLAHLAREFDERNDELAEEYLEGSPARRAKRLRRQAEEAFETLYGRLDRAQRARLTALLQDSPFDPARWLAERRARQRALLDVLRGISAAGNADPGEIAVRLAALGRAFDVSPRADYRQYYQRVVAANCALIADMHGTMRPRQRARAVRRIAGWRADLDALLGAADAESVFAVPAAAVAAFRPTVRRAIIDATTLARR